MIISLRPPPPLHPALFWGKTDHHHHTTDHHHHHHTTTPHHHHHHFTARRSDTKSPSWICHGCAEMGDSRDTLQMEPLLSTFPHLFLSLFRALSLSLSFSLFLSASFSLCYYSSYITLQKQQKWWIQNTTFLGQNNETRTGPHTYIHIYAYNMFIYI